MFSKSFRFILPAAVAAVMAFGASARADLSKEDVNSLIHDYILQNPQLILDSVNDFQKRSAEERQNASLERNHEELFNNEKSPILGNPKGDVTLIEFFDYNCHYCKDVFATLVDLTKEDPKLKVIFKDFPILSETSNTAAKWALAAQQQDKYFEFHKKMMEHKGVLTNEAIEEAAKAVGVDIDQARQFADGPDALLQIERNRTLAQQMDFRGTPSFVINKEAFSGVPDKTELRKKIMEQRKLASSGDKGGETTEEKKAN